MGYCSAERVDVDVANVARCGLEVSPKRPSVSFVPRIRVVDSPMSHHEADGTTHPQRVEGPRPVKPRQPTSVMAHGANSRQARAFAWKMRE